MINERLSYAPIPIRPLHLIECQDYYFPHGITGVGNAQSALDHAIEDDRTFKVAPGVKAQIVKWNGIDGIVAGFSPDGIQVAYGHVQWNPDPRAREATSGFMSYDTAYIVSSEWTKRGIGKLMMQLLETYVAVNNTGIGAGFFYHIQAETEENQKAMKRLLEHANARHLNNDMYLRTILKPLAQPNSAMSVPGICLLSEAEVLELRDFI